jgi:hypothetical protein
VSELPVLFVDSFSIVLKLWPNEVKIVCWQLFLIESAKDEKAVSFFNVRGLVLLC